MGLWTRRVARDKVESRKGDPLKVGERSTVAIAARPRGSDTGVTLEHGANYLLTATGEWVDWNNRSGPDGYPSNTSCFGSPSGLAVNRPSPGSRLSERSPGDRCGYQPATTGECVAGTAGSERLAQSWTSPVGAGQTVVDVDPVGSTPSAASAVRWAVRSCASVEQRDYPTSILAIG